MLISNTRLVCLKVAVILIFVAFLAMGRVYGEAGDAVDADIFDGFEDHVERPSDIGTDEDRKDRPERFKIPGVRGFLGLSGTYGYFSHTPPNVDTDWSGISSLKTRLWLEYSTSIFDRWDFLVNGHGFYDWAYRINGRGDYTDDVLDEYEAEAELGEAYLRGAVLDNVDIKVGRQILVWGKSDLIRVTDVLNPLDWREPGITSIGDLRLPVGMARVDCYWQNWNVTGAYIPEIRFTKRPVFGHDFYTSPQPLPPEDKPSSGTRNAEYGFALEGAINRWEVAFYWADIYRNIYRDVPHIEIKAVENAQPVMVSRHNRIKFYGFAVTKVIPDWSFKFEAAYNDAFEFANSEDEFTRTDVLAGLEYYGFRNTSILLEVANRYINDFDEILEQPPDYVQKNIFQWNFRIERMYLNDRLGLSLLTSTYALDGSDGAFQRIKAEYEFKDNIILAGGVAFYQSGELIWFDGIGKNDRAFMDVRYWF